MQHGNKTTEEINRLLSTLSAWLLSTDPTARKEEVTWKTKLTEVVPHRLDLMARLTSHVSIPTANRSVHVPSNPQNRQLAASRHSSNLSKAFCILSPEHTPVILRLTVKQLYTVKKEWYCLWTYTVAQVPYLPSQQVHIYPFFDITLLCGRFLWTIRFQYHFVEQALWIQSNMLKWIALGPAYEYPLIHASYFTLYLNGTRQMIAI